MFSKEQKRYKLWWVAVGGCSGAYVSFDYQPQSSGEYLSYYVGNKGAVRSGNLGTAVPYNNPGEASAFAFGEVKTSAQGGTARQQGGTIGDMATIEYSDEEAAKTRQTNISVVNGNIGNYNTVYDSYYPPACTPGASTYDGTATGAGAGGGNTVIRGAFQPIEAIEGLVKKR